MGGGLRLVLRRGRLARRRNRVRRRQGGPGRRRLEARRAFLAHGPEVLASVLAAAQPADYVDGTISADLLRLRGIDSVLERAGEIRREWDQVIALMEGSMPGSRELYEERAREIRNSEGWHYADELSYSGAALARAADHLTDRIGVDQSAHTGRVQAALARSASGQRGASTASPPASAASDPPAVRRSR
ncbi:hypothetical protein [Streptomyces chiangmaiensis]|uniref:Uncharacterized protein n=1 Tax=Streptomyces chiangmaiensis TaxID=766497 RepID=A0ABU7FNF3_9ACTN|nr:hypothetical protein [Streptomyces chiangmaiensis]MED7825584.1 hypothetical protein [Streptomyces chiangmaiensis]